MNTILERVNKVCNDVRDSIIEPISFKKLVARTRKIFKSNQFDLLIKLRKEKILGNNEFYVMAYYDAEDDSMGETPIEVNIHYNFQTEEKFQTNQITDFLIQIYDAVVHEYRHQYQSVQRDYEVYSCHEHDPYKEYLGDPDEVDAYAVNIAIELIRTIGHQRALRNLSRISLLSKLRYGPFYCSANLNAYISHYGQDELIRRLAKKVYKHLETLDKRYIFV